MARAARGLLLVALAILASLAVARGAHIVVNFSMPSEISYPNSVGVRVVREFQAGGSIYHDFRQSPHIVALYGPLFYAVPGMVAKLVHADEVTIHRIGRSMALTASAGMLILIALMLRGGGVGWSIVALMTLLYATTSVVWPVGMAFRPDAPESFFVVLGFFVYLRLGRTRWLPVAIVPFVVAFLFKQSAVIGPVAVAAHLVSEGRGKDGLRFAAAAAAGYGVACGAVNLLTGGLYLQNAYDGLRLRVTWSNLPSVVGDGFLRNNLVAIALAVIGTVRRWAGGQRDPYSIFFGLSFAFAAVTTIRDGSADNYFLASVAVACVIGGQELARWLGSVGEQRDAGVAVSSSTVARAFSGEPALLALVMMLVSLLPVAAHELIGAGELLEQLRTRDARNAEQLAYLRSTAQRLDALGGPILCQYDPISLYTRHAYMMDLFEFSGLADQGVFDDRPLIDMIRRRQFAAIVLLFPASTDPTPRYQSTAWVRDEWLRAIRESGYRESEDGDLYIYQPVR